MHLSPQFENPTQYVLPLATGKSSDVENYRILRFLGILYRGSSVSCRLPPAEGLVPGWVTRPEPWVDQEGPHWGSKVWSTSPVRWQHLERPSGPPPLTPIFILIRLPAIRVYIRV